MCIGNLHAQTDSLTLKLAYTSKDYYSFMRNRHYIGLSLFYDRQNFPNAANMYCMPMQNIGANVRIFRYPILVDAGGRYKVGKINSPYQIPALSDIDGKSLSASLSFFPLPYIPLLKRTQEYIKLYAGGGYQWCRLEDDDIRLNLSSWYWKAGCNLFLGNSIPFNLFVEYTHTLNPDKIRDLECISIGITTNLVGIFEYFDTSKKNYSKPLINPK